MGVAATVVAIFYTAIGIYYTVRSFFKKSPKLGAFLTATPKRYALGAWVLGIVGWPVWMYKEHKVKF